MAFLKSPAVLMISYVIVVREAKTSAEKSDGEMMQEGKRIEVDVDARGLYSAILRECSSGDWLWRETSAGETYCRAV
jgi:hypothetical protein